MPEYIQENNQTEICGRYDVIVIGGGVAGVAAALAAARDGAKTLLIEKMVVLGGLATAGHIVYYLPICDGRGTKVIAGIAEELLYASIRYGTNSLPEEWRGGPARVRTSRRYQTEFNAAAFVLALDELLAKAGVDILLDTAFCAPVMENGRCTAVIVENKSGRQAYQCGAAVDASGEADVLFRAGAACTEQDNFLAFWSYYIDRADTENPVKLLPIGNNIGSDLPDTSRKYLGTTVREVTEFVLASRRLALSRVTAGQLTLASFPSMPLFRTTRRLCGVHELTVADIGASFADTIGCTGDWRAPGPIYEVPYRALYAAAVDNIFAAGRNISASGDTWEVTRVIPAAAMTGQAAGIAAAMVARTGCAAAGLPVAELQQRLNAAGAILHRPEC